MMVVSSTATIGASMVEYIDRTISSISSPTYFSTSTPVNSLLLADEPLSNSPRNVLVKGPSKSGKTSLAMETAHATAALLAPCRGHCAASNCKCVASIFLTKIQQACKPFPLFCQQIKQENDFTTFVRDLDTPRTTWNKDALGRIQIHYVPSIRELLEFLLGMHAKDEGERPSACIVVDDIERFVKSEEGQEPLTMPEMMNLVQIMAILADTGHTLSRLQHTPVSIIVTMQSSSCSVGVERIISQWFPISRNLEKVAAHHVWQPLLEDGETCDQVWSIQGGYGSYAVIRQSNGPSRIVWARNNST